MEVTFKHRVRICLTEWDVIQLALHTSSLTDWQVRKKAVSLTASSLPPSSLRGGLYGGLTVLLWESVLVQVCPKMFLQHFLKGPLEKHECSDENHKKRLWNHHEDSGKSLTENGLDHILVKGILRCLLIEM